MARIRYFHHFKGMVYPGPWKERLLALLGPDTEVEFVQPGDAAFIEFVEDVYQDELMGVQFAQDARIADRDGLADVICHSCGAEPGIRPAREVSDTMVMGPACAAMHLASMLGRSFSYVIAGGEGAVGHSRSSIIAAAEHYGLAGKLVSVRTVEATPIEFKEDMVDPEVFARVQEAALDAALAAVEIDGAEVIVGYGGPVMHDWLTEQLAPLGVPVVSPDMALMAFSEALAKLGLSHSRRTYPRPRRVYDVTLTGAPID